MDIYNVDTQETLALRMIDPKTGVDWAVDWVDGAIEYNPETERYEADTRTLDWWIAQMGEHQAMHDLIHEYKCNYGTDAVSDVLSTIPFSDFTSQPYDIFRALTDKFGISRKLDLTRW